MWETSMTTYEPCDSFLSESELGLPWVKTCTEPIANGVKRKHRHEQEHNGDQNCTWVVCQLVLRFCNHAAPAGEWHWDLVTKKAHRSFNHNYQGHHDNGERNQAHQDIGQDITKDNARVARSESSRSVHELTFRLSNDRTLGHACERWDHQNRHADRQRRETRTHRCGQGHQEQYGWESQHDIGNDIDDNFDDTMEVPGNQTKEHAQDHSDG